MLGQATEFWLIDAILMQYLVSRDVELCRYNNFHVNLLYYNL